MKERRRVKEEERKWDRTCTPGGELKEKRGSPHQQGDLLGQNGSFRGLLEDSATSSLWQAGQNEAYTDGTYHSPAHPSLRGVSTVADGGWVLEHGVWRIDSGRGLLLAAGRQPEGMRVRKSATKNVCGGNPEHHSSQVPLWSDA